MRPTRLFRLGARRARQDLREEIYIRTGRDITRPYAIRGLLTRRCNYRCEYCGDWRQEKDPEEMDLAQWQSALLSLKDFIGPYLIQFSGGEPFVFRGFCELMEFCRDNDILAGVVTNGSRLDEDIVRRVVAADPANMDISVDGLGAHSHDKVRGVSGSFERIGAGIATLRHEMVAQGRSFPIRIKTTVHARNFRELPALARWCSVVGASTISFQPVRRWTPEVADGLWLALDKGELDDLERSINDLIALRERGAPIETPPEKLRTWPDHFRNLRTDPGMWPCRVGMGDYHIQANGNVYMCWLHESVGNVKLQAARDIWYGAAARDLRNRILRCEKFGHPECAHSCLSRRPFRQELERGLLVLRRTRVRGK
jgi:radical SAM protein with 4Fe4S-binding SPASM domain